MCTETSVQEPAPSSSADKTPGCLFGEEGLYHWQPVQCSIDRTDSWIFGLEDQFFPVEKKKPEVEPEVKPDELDDGIEGLTLKLDTVDGLTDEFLQFLEKRLSDSVRVSDEDESNDAETVPVVEAINPADCLSVSGVAEQEPVVEQSEQQEVLGALETAPVPPVPPVRRRRLQRTLSLQAVDSVDVASRYPDVPLRRPLQRRPACNISRSKSFASNVFSANLSTVDEYPDAESPGRGYRKSTGYFLGRSSSGFATDLIQRVKRWAAVTSTIRRAFRKVSAPPTIRQRLLIFFIRVPVTRTQVASGA